MRNKTGLFYQKISDCANLIMAARTKVDHDFSIYSGTYELGLFCMTENFVTIFVIVFEV